MEPDVQTVARSEMTWDEALADAEVQVHELDLTEAVLLIADCVRQLETLGGGEDTPLLGVEDAAAHVGGFRRMQDYTTDYVDLETELLLVNLSPTDFTTEDVLWQALHQIAGAMTNKHNLDDWPRKGPENGWEQAVHLRWAEAWLHEAWERGGQ